MFFKKKKTEVSYDPERQEPAVRRSICTGEMTVGFIDRETGRFVEYMKAEDQQALEDFCRAVGVETIRTIY